MGLHGDPVLLHAQNISVYLSVAFYSLRSREQRPSKWSLQGRSCDRAGPRPTAGLKDPLSSAPPSSPLAPMAPEEATTPCLSAPFLTQSTITAAVSAPSNRALGQVIFRTAPFSGPRPHCTPHMGNLGVMSSVGPFPSRLVKSQATQRIHLDTVPEVAGCLPNIQLSLPPW